MDVDSISKLKVNNVSISNLSSIEINDKLSILSAECNKRTETSISDEDAIILLHKIRLLYKNNEINNNNILLILEKIEQLSSPKIEDIYNKQDSRYNEPMLFLINIELFAIFILSVLKYLKSDECLLDEKNNIYERIKSRYRCCTKNGDISDTYYSFIIQDALITDDISTRKKINEHKINISDISTIMTIKNNHRYTFMSCEYSTQFAFLFRI